MSSRHHPPEVPAAVTGMKLRAPFSLGSMVGFWAGGGGRGRVSSLLAGTFTGLLPVSSSFRPSKTFLNFPYDSQGPSQPLPRGLSVGQVLPK